MSQTTDVVSTVREVADAPRTIEGIVIPYGSIATATELGAEAFAPGAFRDSVAKWMDRQDGARMAFRPAHREKPVGVVTSLEDTAAGVRFRAVIRDTPAGDDYLRDVRDGLNGVSAEFEPVGRPTSKGGITVHRTALLHAIAGSVSPAYDGARVANRDMEEAMSNETPAPEPTPTPPPAPTPELEPEPPANRDAVLVSRSSLERAGISAMVGDIRITRAEGVYSRTGEHSYMRDTWFASSLGGGDGAARERKQRHELALHETAVAMERDAYSRIFDPGISERAGDVLSSEIPGAYPTDFIPGLLTPRVLKGRPMGGFYQRIPIADARPRTFPKVTTSTTVAVQSAEGAALTATDLATTAVTVTPLIYGAYTDVSRQALDGGDPSVLAILYQDLIEAYAQASETVIKTAVEAGATAGVAQLIATPYAGALGNVINYYANRFKPATGYFVPAAAFPVLLAQPDSTGRPLMPMLGAVNSDGAVSAADRLTGQILSAQAQLSYASTVNVHVYGAPSDYVIFESAIAQFQYDQIVGPQAVRVGLWAYLVVGTRLGSFKVTAA